MSEDNKESDFCGYCGKSGIDTWLVETPDDFGWECDQDCKEHISCSNCGYAV
jgi:hypothetical protein